MRPSRKPGAGGAGSRAFLLVQAIGVTSLLVLSCEIPARGTPSLTWVHGHRWSGDKMIDRVWYPRGLLAAALSLKAAQACERWRRGVWGSRSQSIFVTTGRRARLQAWSGGSCDRLLVGWLFDRGERLVAEFAQGVVGASAKLAGDREAGTGVAEPLGDLEVVGVVG